MDTAIERRCQCGRAMTIIKDVYICEHCDSGNPHWFATCPLCDVIGKKPGLGPKTGY